MMIPIFLAAVLAAAGGDATPETALPLQPVVTDAEGAPDAPDPKPDAPREAGKVSADPETRTVRIPVRFSGARGVVAWMLSAGKRHRGMSVLVTDRAVREVVAACRQAGLAPGTPPRLRADGRVRPPEGREVELTVITTGADGKETRRPASAFLAASAENAAPGLGRWVYAGPQIAREGASELLVTALSGSLATTDLGDTSALIHWVPAADPSEPKGLPVGTYTVRESDEGRAGKAILEIRAVEKTKPETAVDAPSDEDG